MSTTRKNLASGHPKPKGEYEDESLYTEVMTELGIDNPEDPKLKAEVERRKKAQLKSSASPVNTSSDDVQLSAIAKPKGTPQTVNKSAQKKVPVCSICGGFHLASQCSTPPTTELDFHDESQMNYGNNDEQEYDDDDYVVNDQGDESPFEDIPSSSVPKPTQSKPKSTLRPERANGKKPVTKEVQDNRPIWEREEPIREEKSERKPRGTVPSPGNYFFTEEGMAYLAIQVRSADNLAQKIYAPEMRDFIHTVLKLSDDKKALAIKNSLSAKAPTLKDKVAVMTVALEFAHPKISVGKVQSKLMATFLKQS